MFCGQNSPSALLRNSRMAISISSRPAPVSGRISSSADAGNVGPLGHPSSTSAGIRPDASGRTIRRRSPWGSRTVELGASDVAGWSSGCVPASEVVTDPPGSLPHAVPRSTTSASTLQRRLSREIRRLLSIRKDHCDTTNGNRSRFLRLDNTHQSEPASGLQAPASHATCQPNACLKRLRQAPMEMASAVSCSGPVPCWFRGAQHPVRIRLYDQHEPGTVRGSDRVRPPDRRRALCRVCRGAV